MGPEDCQPGDEVHGHDGHEDHAHDGDHGHSHGGPEARPTPEHFHAHPPGWAINLVLVILAVSSFAVIPLAFMGKHGGWVGDMISHSTAAWPAPGEHQEAAAPAAAGEHAPAEGHGHEALGTFLGMNPHDAMYYVSGIVGLIGIAVAFRLHLSGRTEAATSRADALLPKLGPIPKWAQNKWYVDELYHFLFVRPLWVLSHIFHLIDRMLVDGLVNLAGILPRALGAAIRPSQSGQLHGYAVAMAGGIGLLLLIVILIAT